MVRLSKLGTWLENNEKKFIVQNNEKNLKLFKPIENCIFQIHKNNGELMLKIYKMYKKKLSN